MCRVSSITVMRGIRVTVISVSVSVECRVAKMIRVGNGVE
jgi:hypothetical protein